MMGLLPLARLVKPALAPTKVLKIDGSNIAMPTQACCSAQEDG